MFKDDLLSDPIFDNIRKDFEEAEKKYNPLVRHIKDIEFAALYKVVVEERTRRMARLMIENPAILKMEAERLGWK